jgi:hypothetical protein
MEELSLDIHIALVPWTKATFLKELKQSLSLAIARSPIPIHLHWIEGIEGDFAALRVHGYSLGNAPYVTYVDHDDLVTPDCFIHIAHGLESRPDALFTAEELFIQARDPRVSGRKRWRDPLRGTNLLRGKHRHHFAVYRRGLIYPDIHNHPQDADYQQQYYVGNNGFRVVDVPEVCYYWRQHAENHWKKDIQWRQSLPTKEEG